MIKESLVLVVVGGCIEAEGMGGGHGGHGSSCAAGSSPGFGLNPEAGTNSSLASTASRTLS